MNEEPTGTGNRSSEKSLPQIGKPTLGNKHSSQPEIKNVPADPYSTSVQGIQGDAAKAVPTVASGSQMDNTSA